MQAGLDLVHVPFNGAAPLVTNLVGGQLPSAFVDSASARPHLKSIRPLAVTGTQRIPGLPDVPTFVELGYHSFDPYGWFGLFLPADDAGAGRAEAVGRGQPHPAPARRHGPHRSPGTAGGRRQAGGVAKTMNADAAIYAKIIKDANIRLSQ